MNAFDFDRYRVPPGERVRLSDRDPSDTSLVEGGKADRLAYLEVLKRKLGERQELLYAESRHKLLVILQSPDTGGKDGTIRHVFDGANPQGVKVVSFKQPTPVELSHDFLWRYHQHCPGRGELTIFNRSHYEDVCIVRVHGLVPENVWKRRYDHIRAFEQMLTDEGTVVLKFFLHISKEEQRRRLQRRLDDPKKQWKLTREDLEERRHWDRYQKAFEAMLSRTSTESAPWYVVPANSKSYRNVVVSSVLVHAFDQLQMSLPTLEDARKFVIID